ncbi:hypothetical protein LCGC14_1358630 [marine sediment metagenome]|uniref:Uncharacterized protein n=1 Tax=marine sediment metagenome TaxID=412755 RepID=A0A0F9MP55_9ZZZZ
MNDVTIAVSIIALLGTIANGVILIRSQRIKAIEEKPLQEASVTVKLTDAAERVVEMLRTQLDSQTEQLKKLREENHNLATQVKALTKTNETLVRKVDELELAIQNLSSTGGTKS